MALQTKSSVLSLMVETTEGTPVAPSSATDFIALQDDFSITPNINQIDNAELKSSIGKSKTISGIEEPTATFSHYLRHSGVEGTAPNFSTLLKGSFGSETVASTEYDTVASSTVSVIKVDTGEGVNFQRGQMLLIKDSTNGFSIRPVHSVSSDDLTLGFNLSTAPGTSVNLGKCVLYHPANSGHQSISVWNYVSNGGGVQLMAGGKVTDFNTSIAAGELINSNYTLGGTGYYYDPMVISSSENYLDFTDDDSTYAVTVTAKTYKDPHQLASTLETVMNASGTTQTHSVLYSDTTGKFTIENTTGTTLSLLWSTGTNAANTIGDKLGFSTTGDDTGATAYTSDDAQNYAAPYTPSYDSSDPLVAKDNLCMIGSATDYVCFAANSVDFTQTTSKKSITSICAESGVTGSVINGREVSITVKALLNQYDADKFKRMRTNEETRFCYVGGTKTGGNWTAGKCFGFYNPTTTISAVTIEDDDGLVSLNLELKAYVDDNGNGETYLGFV